MHSKNCIVSFLIAVAMIIVGSTAQAYVVNWSEYSSGRIIDSEYATGGAHNTASTLPPGMGFTVSVNAYGSAPDIAVLYNTNKTGGEDSDLEGGSSGTLFSGGNQDGIAQGNALIIQESANSKEISAGKLKYSSGLSNAYGNAPDDNAVGGTVTFSFESNLVSFGFNWIDLDRYEEVSLYFIDTLTGTKAALSFAAFTTLGSSFYDSSIVFGDHTANQITPISVDALNTSAQVTWSGGNSLNSFNQVVFDNKGSGAISKINFTPVPEPATVAAGVTLLGLAGYSLSARRRKSAITA